MSSLAQWSQTVNKGKGNASALQVRSRLRAVDRSQRRGDPVQVSEVVDGLGRRPVNGRAGRPNWAAMRRPPWTQASVASEARANRAEKRGRRSARPERSFR